MCIICERERASTARSNASSSSRARQVTSSPAPVLRETCYHGFTIGSTIDECPECTGKPWSEEFLEAKNEIEGPDKLLVPF